MWGHIILAGVMIFSAGIGIIIWEMMPSEWSGEVANAGPFGMILTGAGVSIMIISMVISTIRG